MGGLWNALIEDKLGPGGNATDWDETPVRIRNRFIKAVRQVLQSGAAFAASMAEVPAPKKSASKSPKGKRHDPRELHLPLMASIAATVKKKR
jgi:hypothetical protein